MSDHQVEADRARVVLDVEMRKLTRECNQFWTRAERDAHMMDTLKAWRADAHRQNKRVGHGTSIVYLNTRVNEINRTLNEIRLKIFEDKLYHRYTIGSITKYKL